MEKTKYLSPSQMFILKTEELTHNAFNKLGKWFDLTTAYPHKNLVQKKKHRKYSKKLFGK